MTTTLTPNADEVSIFGASPDTWRIDRIRDRLGAIVGGEWGDDPDAHDEGVEIPVIRVADIRGLDVETEDLTIRRVKESKLPGRLIGKRTVLLEKSGGGEQKPVGRAVLGRNLPFNAICSNFMAKTECGPTLDPLFVVYLLDAAYSVGVNGAHIQQTTGIQNLRVFDYLNTHVAHPPLPEQKRIAAYLDMSCAMIDAAVEAKRCQLETLEELLKSMMTAAVTRGLDKTKKLRDSGYVWLGKIPVDWNLPSIKRVVSNPITDGPHETPELSDTGVQFISAEAIKGGRIDFNLRRGFISQELHEQYCRKCKPQKKDIFVVKSGATTGNVAYVDVDFEFSIWSPLALIRCDERIAFYKFIYYVLLTNVFRKQVELSWSFGTQQNIGMRVIERLRVPLPSIAEQRWVADFLDDELSKATDIRKNIETQIATLTAYRKSLIHECVTGHRRITEADINRVRGHG